MDKTTFEICNSEGDFAQVQNYVIQLCGEKKLTTSAFVLYAFYRSLAGFSEIRYGYEGIRLNTGLSKGNITTCNNLLVENGLINIEKRGPRQAFRIHLVPGSTLPRRQLKKNENYDHTCDSSYNEQTVHQLNKNDKTNSSGERINIDYNKNSIKNTNTTAKVPIEKQLNNNPNALAFYNSFISHWCKAAHSTKYIKRDAPKLLELTNEQLVEATKYIPVLWSLDDKWVRESDHSITVFLKEFYSGKLQSKYPNTKYYYIEKQKLEGLS